MIIKGAELNNREKAMFALRALYSGHGFSMYKMSKFESFDLYTKNRDFMDSSSIITFTDTDGKLMALKPDVTLSIVKNNRHIGNDIRKLFYAENIYRVSQKTQYFKEISQVGLECLGQIDEDCIKEVLIMAAESLELVSDEAVLDVSNLDILEVVLAGCRLSAQTQQEIAECIGNKNVHSLQRICKENDVDQARTEILKGLVTTYGNPDEVIPQLKEMILGKDIFSQEEAQKLEDSIAMLETVVEAFAGSNLKEMINIDFSVVGDMKYYNGITFKGFVRGIPDGVLSGGQYDKLMKNMNRKSRAIGFGVYMDILGKLNKFDREEVVIYG